MIDALRCGKISLWGALAHPKCWILKADHHLVVNSYWTYEFGDIPDTILPKKRIPLFHWMAPPPDTLIQANAFWSVRFEGKALSKKGIPFSNLKSMVDQVYAASRRFITPLWLSGTRAATFDWLVEEPQFSSLLIAIKSPIVNRATESIAKKKEKIQPSEIKRTIEASRNQAMTDLTELESRVNSGRLRPEYVSENFAMFDIMHDLLPDNDGSIDTIEIVADVGDGVRSVTFDQRASATIRAAKAAAETSDVTETGPVVQIRSTSNTLVIQSRRGKEVTCEFSEELFNELMNNNEFKTGTNISVRGILYKRVRRDFMDVKIFRIS